MAVPADPTTRLRWREPADDREVVPVAIAAWNDTDEAERALRVTYQERIRKLRGSVEWLSRKIAECRRERDDVLVASYSEERQWIRRQIRLKVRILSLIDARRKEEDKIEEDWWG
jgi:hypothetical protein